MGKQEHSPTPWKINPSGHILNGRNLAITFEGEFFNPGDLAFAVKAVNSHDALVKALGAAEASFDQMAREGGLLSPQDETAHELVRAALKLAKGL